MKKSLIAVAALAATGAFAQSSVTLYGLVDLGVAQSKDTGTGITYKKTGLESMINGSRLGFKGSEDLGGGMKANFTYELGLNPDEVPANFGANNRQSFVGLSGNFGEVRLGRQYTPYHSLQGAFDQVNGNTNTLIGNVQSAFTSRVRASNAIQYATPNFSGFTGTVQYGFGESVPAPGASKTGDNFGLSLVYANGPLAVGYAYDQVKRPAANVISWSRITGGGTVGLLGVAGSDKYTVNGLSGSYDFGVAKAAAQWYDAKEDGAGAAADTKFTGYQLGVSAPFGAFGVGATYNAAKAKVAGVKVADVKGYQLLGTYALSKRTTAYVAYGQDKVDFVGTTLDPKRQQYGVGLRHTF